MLKDYQGDKKSKAILLLNDVINDLRFRIKSTSDKNLKDWLRAYEVEKAAVVLKAVKTADGIMIPVRRGAKASSWEDYKILLIVLIAQIPRPLDRDQLQFISGIRGITALSLSKMGDAKVKKIIRKLESYKDLNEYRNHLNRQKGEEH